MLVSGKGLELSTPNGKPLTQAFDLSLNAGEMLVVEGQNGTGKSTLIKGLLGRTGVLRGHLELNVPQASIAYLPQQQNGAFHLPLSLRELIEITHGRRHCLHEHPEYALLEAHQWELSWNTASGGEKKRALLIRALLYHPQLLILDEPYNHLDKESCRAITQAIFAFLQGGAGRGVMIVSHENTYWQERDDIPVRRLSLDHVRVQR